MDNQSAAGGGASERADKDSDRKRRAKWKRTTTGPVAPPALLDKLTGLPNRRFLESTLHANLEELRRYGRGFGVLFVDVDKMNDVNNLLGRSLGDKVIRSIASSLNKSTRPFDIVGRAGGEEFLAIIVNVDQETLKTVGDKLCKGVEELSVTLPSDTVSVTVSIGGVLAKSDDTKEALIKRAYKQMRQSKESGRNCVTIASD
jgi:diguanylate cyclase (GGDEF)-like protein